MLKVHQEIILSNLSDLVEQTDLKALVPELLKKGVFNKRMIKRILDSSESRKRQKTDLYLEILKRGPQAFAKLEDALLSSNHSDLAERLRVMDAEQSSQIHRPNTFDSVGFNHNYSHTNCQNEGPLHSTLRMVSRQSPQPNDPNNFPQNPATSSGVRNWGDPENGPRKVLDVGDFQNNFSDPNGKVFAPPNYELESLDEHLKKIGFLSENDTLVYTYKQNKPVNVKYATQWQIEATGKPCIYKMDSNPRGCALIVNNWKFNDSNEFPDREGSENDVSRLKQLLTQFDFDVEFHQNKTKNEMENIVKNFSKKPLINDVDCVWVTFMSHGEEGDGPADSHIVGIDGIGYKTEEIVSRFFNDCCPAALNKPKLFFFQACRGCLIDPGVDVGKLTNLNHRIVTDGKRVYLPQYRVMVRTQSDIFIAYPVPDGQMANRDRYTGAWFIQAVVDIFSEHAHNTHLDDLLKMVDQRLKYMNNLYTSNFQAVTIKSIGWNKHLYFNPGLRKDRNTRAKVHAVDPVLSSQPDEGMDVVDVSSTNSDKSPNGATYSRFIGDEDEEDSDSHGKHGCFSIFYCKTS